MVRAILALFISAALLQVGEPFGEFTVHLFSLRCKFADTFLKDIFMYYDSFISSSIVKFHFQTKNGGSREIVKVNGSFHIEGFDRTRPTRVVIHGFWNSHNSRINKALKKAYMENYDVNLIIVNYSRVSRDSCYKIARNRLDLIGRKIANFLDIVLGDDAFQWKNLVLVGHSLGSHTSGIVGRNVRKGKVGAIIALDPAAPGFESKHTPSRLRPDDAEYTQCIHTNGDSLGLMEPICQTDFYPNFGKEQPGCIILADLCSHSRAWKFFAESLTRDFTAYECESMQEILDQTPCNGTSIIMGETYIEAKINRTGVFYLTTNDEPPYSLG